MELNRDKQIKEMAKTMCAFYGTKMCYECRYCCDCHIDKEAERLYNAGYRKASEVALEVIGEIEKIVDKYYNRHIFGVEDLSDVEQEAVMNFSDDITGDLAELKKKYTEGEE